MLLFLVRFLNLRHRLMEHLKRMQIVTTLCLGEHGIYALRCLAGILGRSKKLRKVGVNIFHIIVSISENIDASLQTIFTPLARE